MPHTNNDFILKTKKIRTPFGVDNHVSPTRTMIVNNHEVYENRDVVSWLRKPAYQRLFGPLFFLH